MTSDLILELAVVAFGIAFSPFPIIAIVLVLGSPKKALQKGLIFTGGWVTGLLLLSMAVFFTLELLHFEAIDDNPVVSWIRIVLGVALIVVAVQKWLKATNAKGEEKSPKWMTSIDEMTLQRTGALGAALGGANPKNIAFSLLALSTIVAEELPPTEALLSLVMFIFLSSITILGCLGYVIIAGENSTKLLLRMKEFMTKHNTLIMATLFLIFGIMLLQKGIAGL